MTLAKVTGRVICSVKDPMYASEKLLILRSMQPDGTVYGPSFLAVDAVQAGEGDSVFVIDEGGSARQVLGKPSIGTIRTVIAGIVDEVSQGTES